MKLKHISVALPETVVGWQEICEWTGIEEEMLRKKIGIDTRRFLRQDETVTGLAQKACERLFRETDLTPLDVGLLVCVTQNPDFKLPHTSALLQEALGIPQSCACFDVSLGCSGYVHGLSITKGFMAAQGVENALLVTCDPYSKVMKKDDRGTVPLFGDAAAVTWLSGTGGAEIGIADFGTDGGGASHLMVKAGGSAHPLRGLWGGDPACEDENDNRLFMNGRAIFDFMMRKVPLSIDACLAKNGVSLDQIDHFAFHQPSKYLLDTLRMRLRIPAEKMPIVLEGVGNTVSSTIPIVLDHLNEQNGLPGKKVLISGFGVGLSWGSNILTF